MEGRELVIHLAGPLAGCNERQRKAWRENFRKTCRGFRYSDPTEWDDAWDFSRDMKAVDECDIVVANMWKESIGTTLEIMHARNRGKPVVLIDPNNIEHPILAGLIAPERAVHSVREAAERAQTLAAELQTFQVEKKDGAIEPFSRDKLMRAIRLACVEAGVADFEFPNQIIGPAIAALQVAGAKDPVGTDVIRSKAFAALDALAQGDGHEDLEPIVARVKDAWLRREQYKQGDDLLQSLAEQNRALVIENTRLENLVDQLQRALSDSEGRVRELERHPAEGPPPQPATVIEALSRVERDYAGALVVHPRATRSAKDTPYQHVDRAYIALDLLGRYATERLDAATTIGGRPVGAKEWFRAHQEEAPWLTYKPHESQTSMTAFGGERRVEYEGERLEMEQHLCIGTGDADDLLRIHFAVHQASGQVVVGHCGRHLRNTKS